MLVSSLTRLHYNDNKSILWLDHKDKFLKTGCAEEMVRVIVRGCSPEGRSESTEGSSTLTDLLRYVFACSPPDGVVECIMFLGCPVRSFFVQYLAKKLTGKNVSEMTYFVSGGT